ncbi:hypothetical protein ACFVXE_10425 [Streptomyces sp. NPDC058231]|uniref:hypothetical protein n=1 Tax=unclassified Streptomyces TaxID=2593676 RepID=UPI0036E07554
MPNDAYRCGQLYAALEALQSLADVESRSLSHPESRQKAARQPLTHMKLRLWTAGKYLEFAWRRGRGPAAGAVFRSIPELMPPGRELPGTLSADGQKEFERGRQAQVEAIGKASVDR